jgi:hypothetical protein
MRSRRIAGQQKSSAPSVSAAALRPTRLGSGGGDSTRNRSTDRGRWRFRTGPPAAGPTAEAATTSAARVRRPRGATQQQRSGGEPGQPAGRPEHILHGAGVDGEHDEHDEQ